ncbi:MAG: hypothetical protein LH606_08290, partial [Cytophagaceae bacterium]|nr:hypothetical protein [Cytophagaceae bacterium]
IVSLILIPFGSQIATLLFSNEFTVIHVYFPIQLVGDLMRIITWVLVNVLFAKAYIKEYIIFELTFGFIYIILVKLLIGKFELLGVCYAYAANYALYSGWLMVYMNKVLLK